MSMKRPFLGTLTVAALVVAGCTSHPASGMYAALNATTVGAQAAAQMGNQAPAANGAHAYFVDCSQSANGNGTESSPWNSVATASAHAYQPGDMISLKRGTTCEGMFAPQGSGTASAPITLSAYGHGQLPVIDGGLTNNAALYLTNQSYWVIENLALQGGMNWGLVAKALNNATVSGLTIENVIAKGATSVAHQRALSGEIGLLTDGTSSATISDVSISYVTVGDTTTGEGIFIKAGQHGAYYGPKGQNISVTNSKIENVYGDGLLVADGENVTLSHNIVTGSGACPNCTGSTPGALWIWNSVHVEMSWNESYKNTSWGVDGGGMDIDYLNRDVTVEHNYIHDNKGYCVSVFGAGHQQTYKAIVRFNVCANNDNQPTTTQPGNFLVSTWDGGSINGVQIYNNTIYWAAPRANNYVLQATGAQLSGTLRNLFVNNLIYTPLQHPYLIAGRGPLKSDNNLYFSPDTAEYTFLFNGSTWNDLATYQKGSGQDAHSLIADPLLGDPSYDVDNVWPKDQLRPQQGSPAIGAGVNVCAGYPASVCSMGDTDFFGKPLPTSELWIGAIQEDYNQMSASGTANSN